MPSKPESLESGRGIQVVTPGPEHTFNLDEDSLSALLLREDIRDRAVVVLSVAGAFRKGKSFLLDFFLRYMHHKVKLYNNLAHCQLQYDEYGAALQLCNKALKYDPENVKALYRRCISYSGLNLYEEAWADIQCVLKLDPNDKAAQNKATALRPKVEKINKEYTNVMKKMFN